MNLRDGAQDFLDTLGERLGIGVTEFSDEGEAVIRCDFRGATLDVLVLAQEDLDTLSLTTAVGDVPDDDEKRAALAAALLTANMLGIGANGLSFSFSPKDKRAYLGYTLLWPGATYEAFESAFARLVASGTEWQEKLAVLPIGG